MAKSPRVGEPAPDFELEGTEGRFRLSAHRGERVVLLFYPGDETPVCTRQFCSYRDDEDRLQALDATIVGISGQDVASHEAFVAAHGLTVPLLADVDHAVARAYDALTGPLNLTRRAVVIVDEAGIVRYRHDHRFGLDYQDAGELERALAALPRREPT
jgi:peroxiredoxin Q/BCP